MKKIIYIFIALAFTFFFLSKVNAQNTNGIDLTVSPPVFDLVAKPGETITHKFRIKNNGTTSQKLKIDARRLISDPANGSPQPEDTATGEELSWVSFDKDNFTAPAREWTDVNYTIKIPDTAAFGYYYVFRISPEKSVIQQKSGTAIKGEVLVVVLLNVQKEGAISSAKLIKFGTDNLISQYLPINFQTTLQNTGNVHVKPRGNIFISRDGKTNLGVLEVNNGLGSILPDGTRKFEASWNDGFLVEEPVFEGGELKLNKDGKPYTKLTINWNKLTEFRIGPYTARLLLVYDDGTRDQTIESEVKFWVIPYIPIAVIITSFILAFFIIRFFLRRYIAAQIRKAQK